MFAMTGLYVLVLVPAGLLGLLLRRPGRYRMAIAAGVFVVETGLLWVAKTRSSGRELSRPLPLLVPLTIAALVACFLHRRHEEAAQYRLIRQISLLVFAMVLLGKMILNTLVTQYGFVLAMPATLLMSLAALDWVPGFIDRRGGYGGVFAAAALALISVALFRYLQADALFVGMKTLEVGSGADAFWADPLRADPVNIAVAEIARRASPNTTLAVLPEGSLINCITGLRNPTPYINLMPVEMGLFGEARILDSFRVHPPDLVVVVHKDTAESAPLWPGLWAAASRLDRGELSANRIDWATAATERIVRDHAAREERFHPTSPSVGAFSE